MIGSIVTTCILIGLPAILLGFLVVLDGGMGPKTLLVICTIYDLILICVAFKYGNLWFDSLLGLTNYWVLWSAALAATAGIVTAFVVVSVPVGLIIGAILGNIVRWVVIGIAWACSWAVRKFRAFRSGRGMLTQM